LQSSDGTKTSNAIHLASTSYKHGCNLQEKTDSLCLEGKRKPVLVALEEFNPQDSVPSESTASDAMIPTTAFKRRAQWFGKKEMKFDSVVGKTVAAKIKGSRIRIAFKCCRSMFF
jgi:hypothetical protein